MLSAHDRQAHNRRNEERLPGLLERRQQQIQQALRTDPRVDSNYQLLAAFLHHPRTITILVLLQRVFDCESAEDGEVGVPEHGLDRQDRAVGHRGDQHLAIDAPSERD